MLDPFTGPGARSADCACGGNLGGRCLVLLSRSLRYPSVPFTGCCLLGSPALLDVMQYACSQLAETPSAAESSCPSRPAITVISPSGFPKIFHSRMNRGFSRRESQLSPATMGFSRVPSPRLRASFTLAAACLHPFVARHNTHFSIAQRSFPRHINVTPNAFLSPQSRTADFRLRPSSWAN